MLEKLWTCVFDMHHIYLLACIHGAVSFSRPVSLLYYY